MQLKKLKIKTTHTKHNHKKQAFQRFNHNATKTPEGWGRYVKIRNRTNAEIRQLKKLLGEIHKENGKGLV